MFASRLEVSPRELALLRALAVDGPMIARELGTRFDVPFSTMTGLVDRMESKGLVRRVPHRRDRRSVELEATTAGRHALQEHARGYEAIASGILGALPGDEQRTLIAILRRVRAAVETSASRRVG